METKILLEMIMFSAIIAGIGLGCFVTYWLIKTFFGSDE